MKMSAPQHIADVLSTRQTLSIEIMPPKSRSAEENLQNLLHEISGADLSFVSVTYGAGGSTRQRTASLVRELLKMPSCLPMAHLTCIAHTRDDIRVILDQYRDEGLVNLLALLGDPPANDPDFVSPKQFQSAIELVRFAKEIGDFSVGVAMHPEGHPAAMSVEQDRDHQAEKLRSADFGITQFFFEAETYFSFVHDMHARETKKPIIPGVIAPLSVVQLERLSALSGATIPGWVAQRLDSATESASDGVGEIATSREGVQIAAELARKLLEGGAPGVHLYTMNNAAITRLLLSEIANFMKGQNV